MTSLPNTKYFTEALRAEYLFFFLRFRKYLALRRYSGSLEGFSLEGTISFPPEIKDLQLHVGRALFIAKYFLFVSFKKCLSLVLPPKPVYGDAVRTDVRINLSFTVRETFYFLFLYRFVLYRRRNVNKLPFTAVYKFGNCRLKFEDMGLFFPTALVDLYGFHANMILFDNSSSLMAIRGLFRV